MHSTTAVNTLHFFGIMQPSLFFMHSVLLLQKKFYSQAHHTHFGKYFSFWSMVRGACVCMKKRFHSLFSSFFQSLYTKRIIFVTRNSYINYKMNAHNSHSSTTSNCVSISTVPPLYCLTLFLKRKKCNIFQSIHFALNFVLS